MITRSPAGGAILKAEPRLEEVGPKGLDLEGYIRPQLLLLSLFPCFLPSEHSLPGTEALSCFSCGCGLKSV